MLSMNWYSHFRNCQNKRYVKKRFDIVSLFTASVMVMSLFLISGCQLAQNIPFLQASDPEVASIPDIPQSEQPVPGQQLQSRTEALPPVSGARTAEPASKEVSTAPDTIPVINFPSDMPKLDPSLYQTPGMASLNQSRSMILPPISSDSVRVGLLLPLSGKMAFLGQALLNAAQLALFDFADSKFEMVIHDTKGTPRGAAEAARLAIGDGARLILGPMLSGSVRAVTPAAQAAGVPVIAFSSDESVAGNNIYVMGFSPAVDAERVVSYAYEQGIQRFAGLFPDNVEGNTVARALRNVASVRGFEITDIMFYDPAATDFSDPVRILANFDNRKAALKAQRKALKARSDDAAKSALARLKHLQTLGDLPFEGLLMADGGKRMQAVAALLPFYDIDPAKVQMLGTGRWDDPAIGAEPAMMGGWYAAPPPDARLEFQTRYKNAFNVSSHRLSTLAYDAVALASVLAQSEGGADFSIASITSSSGYWGRDGIFRFRREGVAERGLSVLEINRQTPLVISPAPDSFYLASGQ